MLLVPALHERLPSALAASSAPCAALPDSWLPIKPAAWLKKKQVSILLARRIILLIRNINACKPVVGKTVEEAD